MNTSSIFAWLCPWIFIFGIKSTQDSQDSVVPPPAGFKPPTFTTWGNYTNHFTAKTPLTFQQLISNIFLQAAQLCQKSCHCSCSSRSLLFLKSNIFHTWTWFFFLVLFLSITDYLTLFLPWVSWWKNFAKKKKKPTKHKNIITSSIWFVLFFRFKILNYHIG